MRYQTGANRDQLFLTSLSEFVSDDSWARVVELFVEAMPIEEFGFMHSRLNKEGNVPYHPKDMFKLYLYGYRHGIRSANQLARACKINMEVKWLLKGLEPSARKINYFRSNNTQAIKRAHEYFIRLLKQWELVDGKTMVIDGTKIRAQNGKRNNYNSKKIKRHLKHVEGNIEQYLEQLTPLENKAKKSKSDNKKINQLKDKIRYNEQKKEQYQELEKEIENSEDGQVSKVDMDARAVGGKRTGIHVGYNMQTTVDAKHKLIVDVFSGRVNDCHELGKGAQRAKGLLGMDTFDILADTGYYTGSELKKCEDLTVTPYVCPKRPKEYRKDGYGKADFIYDAALDTYLCPQNQQLKTDGKHHRRTDRDEVKIYTSPACNTCTKQTICSPHGRRRRIERSVYQSNKDENDKRLAASPAYYQLRQQMVEHVFGTLKRSWGITHAMVRGKEKVENEFTLAAICYNLTRMVNVLGMKKAKEQLKRLILIIFKGYIPPSDLSSRQILVYPF